MCATLIEKGNLSFRHMQSELLTHLAAAVYVLQTMSLFSLLAFITLPTRASVHLPESIVMAVLVVFCCANAPIRKVTRMRIKSNRFLSTVEADLCVAIRKTNLA